MILLFWLFMILVPFLVGTVILYLLNRNKSQFVVSICESFLLGLILCIGIMEATHLACVFGIVSLSVGALVFLLTAGAIALGGAVLLLWGVIRKKGFLVFPKVKNASFVYPAIFLLLVLTQVLYVYLEPALVIKGDITLETVQSFVAEQGIYRVNPLTGQAYHTDMPFRYKILCLPTLYAVLATGFQVPVELTVLHLVPAIFVMFGYLAYYRLGKSLFGKEYNKRYAFLIIVALLLWFGESQNAMEGYQALHGAYLGTSVRNLILIPLVFAMAMEKKWGWCVLCILAEACIVWTFYGLGICFAITAAMFVISYVEHHWDGLCLRVKGMGRKEK